MRIVSGIHKSKRIVAPKNLPVRPTTDMAKEALFNILNNHYYFDNLSVLDLFSGTGNIAYEFASRGTKNILAVDAHYACVKFISKTAKDLNMPIRAIKSDVYSFLEKGATTYDLIFADPPYDFETAQFSKITDLVFEKKLLNQNGVLVIEHSKYTKLEDHPHFSYAKRYGSNVFSFFEAIATDEEE